MNQKRNLVILFATMVIMMIGFGIIIPILPFYVEHLGGGGIAMGLLMAIFSLMQFLFSPIWGALSDRFGRKPILMVGVFGNAATMVLLGISTSIPMLITMRGLAGILSSATLPTAMAFISDSTDEKSRGGGMGIVGAAMGLGMVLGPSVGGIFARISLQAPFYFAGALSLLAVALIWWLLPESLTKENRTGELKLKGPQLDLMWKSLFGPAGFLFFTALMINFAMTNFEGIFPFYAENRFGFDEFTVGVILTVVGVVSFVVQGGLTGVATRRFGDVWVIKVSLAASAVGFIIMLLAQDLAGVLITTSIFIFSNAMLRPATSSLISKEAGMSQGIAMGLNNAYMSLGRVLGPLWAGVMIDVDLRYPFFTGSVIMLLGFIASLFFLKERAARPQAETAQAPSAD
jgi:DHA1 family multidrug resistance protein-like MFS transporter